MKTLAPLHVGSDVLVARQAQNTHARLVGTVVTTGALLFVLGMGRGQLPGHQKCFEGCRSSKSR